MNSSNTEYYIICLVIFVFFLFVMHRNKSSNYNQNNSAQNSNKKNKSNDKFTNTEDLKILDYINDNINSIHKRLDNQNINCQKEVNKHSTGCKFGGNFVGISNEIKGFNNKLDIYSKYVQDEKIDNKLTNIQNNMEELKSNDSKIYNELTHTEESSNLQEPLLRVIERLNKQVDDNQDLSYNPELHKETFLSVANPSDLCGTYTVIPYQYKNFNNIEMALNLKDGCDSNSDNSISFFLVDNSINSNKRHLVTYNISNIAFVDSSIINQLDKQQSENTGGIEFMISQKMVANDIDSDVLRLIIKVLDDIRFTVGEKYYFFLANGEYNKILYNVNKPEYEGSKLFGNDETKYYLKNQEKIYRIYNKHTRMLLSMIR